MVTISMWNKQQVWLMVSSAELSLGRLGSPMDPLLGGAQATADGCRVVVVMEQIHGHILTSKVKKNRSGNGYALKSCFNK